MTITYSAEPVMRWGLAQRRFTLTEGFDVTWIRKGHEVVKFRVDAGFATDLASIPRIFQGLIPKYGRHTQPAIVHDWGYEGHTDLSKRDVDLLFLDGMKMVRVGWLKRHVMYWAVRIGGNGHWAKRRGAEV